MVEAATDSTSGGGDFPQEKSATGVKGEEEEEEEEPPEAASGVKAEEEELVGATKQAVNNKNMYNQTKLQYVMRCMNP